MDELETQEAYWNAIRALEEVLESGHRTKEEIVDDLGLEAQEDRVTSGK